VSTGGATGFPGDGTQASQHVVSGSFKCRACGTVATGRPGVGFDEAPGGGHECALTEGLHTKRYDAEVAKAPCPIYETVATAVNKMLGGRREQKLAFLLPLDMTQQHVPNLHLCKAHWTHKKGKKCGRGVGDLSNVNRTNMAGWPSGLRRWF
jgi:hypothetical protein